MISIKNICFLLEAYNKLKFNQKIVELKSLKNEPPGNKGVKTKLNIENIQIENNFLK